MPASHCTAGQCPTPTRILCPLGLPYCTMADGATTRTSVTSARCCKRRWTNTPWHGCDGLGYEQLSAKIFGSARLVEPGRGKSPRVPPSLSSPSTPSVFPTIFLLVSMHPQPVEAGRPLSVLVPLASRVITGDFPDRGPRCPAAQPSTRHLRHPNS